MLGTRLGSVWNLCCRYNIKSFDQKQGNLQRIPAQKAKGSKVVKGTDHPTSLHPFGNQSLSVVLALPRGLKEVLAMLHL